MEWIGGGKDRSAVDVFLDPPSDQYHKFVCQTRIRNLRLLRLKVLAIPLHLHAMAHPDDCTTLHVYPWVDKNRCRTRICQMRIRRQSLR